MKAASCLVAFLPAVVGLSTARVPDESRIVTVNEELWQRSDLAPDLEMHVRIALEQSKLEAGVERFFEV